MMRILIATDAWFPQVNGVVRSLDSVRRELVLMGHVVEILSPDQYRNWPCPTYPEIRLAFPRARTVGERIADFRPDAVHIATEGPLCLAARRWCIGRGVPFTTAYHTQFPDYVQRRTGIPANALWRYIRWFHRPAQRVLTATPSIRAELAAHGVGHVVHWGRGVDLDLFHSGGPRHPAMADLSGPVQLYVGRIAVEKNLEAFLRSERPGTKVIVGEGPARAALQARYPDALWLGALHGATLASAYRSADILVFPSLTDTFGLVIIEALASGLPVAAFPVTGPRDILTDTTGAIDQDLNRAIDRALTCDRGACIALARKFSWRTSAEQFLDGLAPVPCVEPVGSRQ
jgi:glycosyltransferase involved in cell wall biosynthesis